MPVTEGIVTWQCTELERVAWSTARPLGALRQVSACGFAACARSPPCRRAHAGRVYIRVLVRWAPPEQQAHLDIELDQSPISRHAASGSVFCSFWPIGEGPSLLLSAGDGTATPTLTPAPIVTPIPTLTTKRLPKSGAEMASLLHRMAFCNCSRGHVVVL